LAAGVAGKVRAEELLAGVPVVLAAAASGANAKGARQAHESASFLTIFLP
jgi:hypothetical protein